MIPERYKNADLKKVPKDILEAFEDIFKSHTGLYIHGNVGCGKTYIAYALYKKTLETHKAEFWNVSELLEEIRLDYERDNYSKTRHNERLNSFTGLLFLDDIGAERITDWVLDRFYLLINKRYENMLPTVFTSNLTVKELAERVGDRIASRIVEGCNIVKKEGKDMRVAFPHNRLYKPDKKE